MTNSQQNPMTSQESFYADINDQSDKNLFRSCLWLFILCMIVYLVTITLIWYSSPWFRNIERKAREVKGNINLTNQMTDPKDIKELISNTFKKSEENLNKSIENKIKEKSDSIINQSQKTITNQLENRTQNLLNQ